MIRILTMLSLMFTCAFSSAQVNYVLNPDFEEYSFCPTQVDHIDAAINWAGINGPGSDCVPQYCNTCSNNLSTGVPVNGFFYQYPHSGNGFAFLHPYYEGDSAFAYTGREYLLGKLHTNLTANHTYCVSFYVVLAEESGYAINKLGVYFDDGSIVGIDSCGYPQTQFSPQVENVNGIISDTLNWVKIEGSFVATGTEQYLTIGNFSSNANTDTLKLNYLNDLSYYLIDDVSVIETNLPAFAGNDTWVVEGDSVFIGRTPEVGLECKWYVNGNVIDSGAGIWVHPTVTTTYVVEQTICGLVKTDTVTIEVWATSVNGITNGQQISIYPNPAINQLLVQQEKLIFTTALITNQLGQHISSQPLSGKETKVDISSLPAGVYSITLEGEKGREVRRFVKI